MSISEKHDKMILNTNIKYCRIYFYPILYLFSTFQYAKLILFIIHRHVSCSFVYVEHGIFTIKSNNTLFFMKITKTSFISQKYEKRMFNTNTKYCKNYFNHFLCSFAIFKYNKLILFTIQG